jgi:hypothetical protein
VKDAIQLKTKSRNVVGVKGCMRGDITLRVLLEFWGGDSWRTTGSAVKMGGLGILFYKMVAPQAYAAASEAAYSL